MTNPEELDALAEAIVAQAIRRLKAENDAARSQSQIEDAAVLHGPPDVPFVDVRREGVDFAAARTSPGQIARFIDHTLLKPDATYEDLVRLCDEAREFGFATVCVNGGNVKLAARLLAGSGVGVVAVVGFPLGAMTSAAKAFETREAVGAGAGEIDMVINVGALRSRDLRVVFEDIAAVVGAAAPAPVKVILETSQLTQDEKILACALSKAAGAAFVKTSTGFGGGGATVEDIELMRRIVGTDVGVKASGGVRSLDDALRMLEGGADRLGASASVAIVTGGDSKEKY